MEPKGSAMICAGSKGFTLIELSIVLVIIGLLIGSILVGRDLIRVAELQRLHGQAEGFVAAADTFRMKYNCMPGDCETATNFFPSDSACDYTAGPGWRIDGQPGLPTCDGDGDGKLDYFNGTGPAAPYGGEEGELFWQHLADARLVEGVYSGMVGSNGSVVPGYNCPVIAGGHYCWQAEGSDSPMWLPAGFVFLPRAGGVILMTMPYIPLDATTAAGTWPFSPSDAQLYDSKYDDGFADTGNVLGVDLEGNCLASVAGRFAYDVSPASKDLRNCGVMTFTGF